jgi:hypothetical protein
MDASGASSRPVQSSRVVSVRPADREKFEIDEDGSFLHWSEPDIHLDLDTFRVAINPSASKRAFDAKAIRNIRYGKAIARLRLEKGLKQSAIPGLSERQVRRFERGESSGYESLGKMAAAHGVSLDEYLNELATINAEMPDSERA